MLETLNALDQYVTLHIRPTAYLKFWWFISRLGDGLLYVAVFACLRYLGAKGEADKLAAGILIAWGISAALKIAVRRRRPMAAPSPRGSLPKPSTWSFPSQHSAVAIAVAYAMWPNPIAALLAAGICASRVLIGAHYLGDVLAGVLVGLVAGRLS
jgi:undecaprenyl-diphosphatase